MCTFKNFESVKSKLKKYTKKTMYRSKHRKMWSVTNNKKEDSSESEESEQEDIEDEEEKEDAGTEQDRDNMQAGGRLESQ